MDANFRRELQYLGESRSILKCSFGGSLDHRTVGDWLAEGNAKFYDIGAGSDSGEDDFTGGGEIGIAAGDVGDEGWTVYEG